MNVLQAISIIINLIVLIKASKHDIRMRRVPNLLWIYQIGGQIVLGVIYIALNYHSLNSNFVLVYFLNSSAVFVFSYFLYQNKAWGGADSKAVILLICSSPYLFLGYFAIYNLNFLPLIVPFILIFNVVLLTYTVFNFLYRWVFSTTPEFSTSSKGHSNLPGLVFITITYGILILIFYINEG